MRMTSKHWDDLDEVFEARRENWVERRLLQYIDIWGGFPKRDANAVTLGSRIFRYRNVTGHRRFLAYKVTATEQDWEKWRRILA